MKNAEFRKSFAILEFCYSDSWRTSNWSLFLLLLGFLFVGTCIKLFRNGHSVFLIFLISSLKHFVLPCRRAEFELQLRTLQLYFSQMECLKTERSQIKSTKTVDAFDIFRLIPGTNNPLPFWRNVKEICCVIRSEENRKGNNNPRFSIELCIQNEGLESK